VCRFIIGDRNGPELQYLSCLRIWNLLTKSRSAYKLSWYLTNFALLRPAYELLAKKPQAAIVQGGVSKFKQLDFLLMEEDEPRSCQLGHCWIFWYLAEKSSQICEFLHSAIALEGPEAPQFQLASRQLMGLTCLRDMNRCTAAG
jgi:hypothetical protein